MADFLSNLVANLAFVLERMDWLSILDIFLVAAVFFVILRLLRGTQAMTLLRGVIVLVALLGVLTTLEVLPAFSWLVRTTLPAVLFAIPVIFAPEIRHALERLGRAGVLLPSERVSRQLQDTVEAIVTAATRLSARQHGALIVLERRDHLNNYADTGVKMDSYVTPELLLQIFYPNTPLHDGAVIISESRVVAAACVLPLSASGVLMSTPERQVGLRHRAALGISEVSDGVAVVVSEETGWISVVHGGKMIRRLDADRLENILRALFRPALPGGIFGSLSRRLSPAPHENEEAS